MRIIFLFFNTVQVGRNKIINLHLSAVRVVPSYRRVCGGVLVMRGILEPLSTARGLQIIRLLDLCLSNKSLHMRDVG